MNDQGPDIWQFQRLVVRRLLAWSSLSVIVGLALLAGGRFWRGFAFQTVTGGVVEGLIALAGRWLAGRRRTVLPEPDAPLPRFREARYMRRLLWLSVGVDILYMLGGLLLARMRGRTDRGWLGQGWGIIFQAAFLVLFDLYHALVTPAEIPPSLK